MSAPPKVYVIGVGMTKVRMKEREGERTKRRGHKMKKK